MAELQTCGNCGRIIGRLEQPHLWERHVVCASCAQVLQDSALQEAARGSLRRAPSRNSDGSRTLVLTACVGAVAVSITAAVATYLHYNSVATNPRAGASPAAPTTQPAPNAPRAPIAEMISPAAPRKPAAPASVVRAVDEPVRLFDEVPSAPPTHRVKPKPVAEPSAPKTSRAEPRQPVVAKTAIQAPESFEPKVVAANEVSDAAPASRTPVALTGAAGQIEKGKQLLATGNFKDAAVAFRDALDSDKNSALAQHGLAIATFQIGDKPRAITMIEKAVNTADNTNRAIVYNLAVMHLRGDNPMRAAKFVRDYLARPNAPLDEPLQNVLGAALAGANDATRAGLVFPKLRDFYFQYDAKLATAKASGTARWGMRWIPSGQAEQKWAQSKARAEAYAKAQYDANHAALGTKKAQQAVYDLNHSFGLHSDRERIAVNRDLQSAAKNESEIRKRLDQEQRNLNATDMPEFPKTLDFIPIDATRPDQSPPQH